MVLASRPVASVIRLAARPVGAASRTSTLFAARIFRMALTSVVLPPPGPPVMTTTLDARAIRTAACWLSASVTPSFACTHAMALSASMVGQGGWPSPQGPEPLGDGPLGLPQLPHEDAWAVSDGVGDHHAVPEFEVDRVFQDLGRD